MGRMNELLEINIILKKELKKYGFINISSPKLTLKNGSNDTPQNKTHLMFFEEHNKKYVPSTITHIIFYNVEKIQFEYLPPNINIFIYSQYIIDHDLINLPPYIKKIISYNCNFYNVPKWVEIEQILIYI